MQAAAEVPATTGSSDQLIITVGAIITAAIVTLGGVLVAVVNSRANKTTASPPSPTAGAGGDHVLYERTAVLGNRADDSDERFEILDRRVDQIERVLDIDNPHWRGRR